MNGIRFSLFFWFQTGFHTYFRNKFRFNSNNWIGKLLPSNSLEIYIPMLVMLSLVLSKLLSCYTYCWYWTSNRAVQNVNLSAFLFFFSRTNKTVSLVFKTWTYEWKIIAFWCGFVRGYGRRIIGVDVVLEINILTGCNVRLIQRY